MERLMVQEQHAELDFISFVDNGSLPQKRGNSYFVWFRVDDAKLQIYKVVNDVFGSPLVDIPFTTTAGQWYDYKIIYDRFTGKIAFTEIIN